MARRPRVPKAPRIGGGGRKRGPLSVETKTKIARSLARVKGDTTDWDPYEKKGRAPGKGGSGSSGAGKKAARMTTTTSKGGAKVTSGIDKRTGNKVTVSKTSGTAGKNRKNAKATANPFGDFPNNTVKGGGHQASKEYLTPDNIRTEPGFRSDLQAVADRLTTPAKAEKYLDRLDDRMVRAMEDTGSPAKNRHNQRAAIHNYTQARELGLIDAELNRTGKKPVMPSKDKLPDVKAGDPEGNAKRAKGINAPVAGGKAKQAPKMKATTGKRKPATAKGEKAGDKPAKAAKASKPTAKANKGNKATKSAKNANTKPAKHPKVHGTYTPEEQAAERANPGRKGGIIDREAENLTPRQLNRLARYYGLDNEQKINQLGVDKGNKKFRHTPEFEKSYDKWLAKTVAPALDKLDPNGTIDRNDPEAVLGALGVGRKDGVDTRRALTSPIYFQTLSGDVRAAIAEHVGFVPSPVNMQRSNRGEKRPAVFAEAFAIQHRRQKAGELPKFAEDKKPVKRPKGKRKNATPAKPVKKAAAKNTAKSTEKTAEKRNNGITYRPADGDNMPAIGYHDGVTAKGTYITRPDGSQVRGDVKPVKVDTDPDRADRYDTAGRYAQITSDGKHLIVAKDESKLDDMLRDYDNSRGEVGKLVADNGEAPERDLGLSDWKNGNRDRTYVNKWHEPAGFEFETYKNSGRPKWATIDGKGISNTRADALRGGKVWVDNKTGELHVEAGNDELPADKIAERLAPELEKQLGRSVVYQPKKGGNKPGVKPDAKPNAGAEEAANKATDKAGNAEDEKAATIAALTPYLAAEPRHLADTPETINDPVQKAVDKAKAPERVAESVTDNRDMADRLLDLATARSRDRTLPMLTGVNFDVNDGEATVAATDRFRLATEHVKIDAPNGKHLVEGKDFEEAMRAMRGVEGDFKLTDNDDGTYTLTRGDVSRNLKGVPAEFPKVAPLMPRVTEETPRFTVNAPALRKVALEAKRNSTRYGGLHFKPVDGKDAYHVSWTDKYGDVRTVDVPAKFSNDNSVDRPTFAVNQTYLAGILGGVKGDVTIGNAAGHRPLRIITDGEEQPTRLLMPIRADVPDMVAKPDVNNEARKQLNYLYDALATPKENRVAFNAKELRSLIKTAHEQATKDVKEGTPEYFLHATPDGRVRIAAGNAKSGVKVYGEMGIEPGQREMIIPLPNRDNRGNAIKAATINSNFRGDNAVFRVDDDGTVWLTTVSNETADQRNKGTVFAQGAVPIAHTPDMVRKYKQLLKKNGYDPDQGDSNDGMAALPGLNDVSKFDGDAAVKRAEKMEADRTRRELDEVGMTDAEKQTATAKRDNMPRLDGQNGLQAKAPTKATSKPDTQSSYTTAELKERGWKPKDIKALKEHKTTEKHRSATGVVDSFENNSRGQFTGYNLNRYDGDAVRDYEKGKDLGPHRVPTPPQIDGLELTSNKTRNGKTFFNVDNLADFTQNPEWFNVRLTPEGDVNIYEGKRLPPFPDGDDETWQWDTEKEALEKRLADALNGNVRHVERKPVQKQTRPPLPEGETLDRRDNVVRFRKSGGEWAVEGEDLQVGDVVTVKKRGGKKSTVTITELVSDENGHQVARFKNGGGRSRRAKRNTTTGGAKLDGQNRLQATKPQRARRGVEPIQQHELEDGENLTGIGDTVIQRGESQIRKGKDGYYVTGAGQSREGTPVATLESARKLADRYNTDNAAKVAEANAKDEADNAARRKLYDANPGDMKASRMDANVENALFTQSGTVRKNPKLRNLTDGELSRALDRDDLNTDMRKAIKGEQKNRELNGQNGLNATTPEIARRNKLSGNGAPLDPETGYQKRGQWVMQTVKRIIDRDGDSQARYSTVKDDGTRDYSPERLVKHAEIINRLIAEAEADGPIPRDRKALFTGGIGGSGKGATLKERNKGEGTKYLTLNADDVKEVMAEMGMIEVPDNMTPMEGVALIHEESSDITSALADRAYKQGMNVVWDITMGSTGSVQKRIDDLRENGYTDIVGTFTDVPLEVSVNGAAQRYARGMDKFINGDGYGGRYVPENVIRKAETETPGVTRNKQVFNSLRDQFDSWEVWDNNRYNDSGDRQPPLMVDSGTAPERNQNDSARRLPSGQRNNGGGQSRGGATAARNDQAEATVQAAGSERPEVDSLINLQGSDSRTIDRGTNVGGNARDTGVNQRRAADMTEAERHATIVEMNNRLLDGDIDAEEYERTVWDMEHPDGPDYDNRPTPDEGAGDALHHISNPDARIQITHTEEEGTLVHGTSRDDKVGPAMRANGFKWSRNLKAWYAPRSRDKRPDSYKISRLHQALKDQGLDVGLDVDRRMGDAQRREERRDQRSADRIAALGEKVQRKQAAANAAWNTHFNRVDELPPDGEPIKVGHHSEKRHRRALDNAWKSLGRAVDAGKAVEDAQYRMEAAERSRRSRNRPQTVANRIEKLEKQIKKSRDQLNGAPAYKGGAPRAPLTGDRRIRALNAIDADMQDLNLQRAIFEQLKADGKVVDIHDLNPGDKVKLYGEWVPVVKVNKTTASMANGWKLKQGEATVVKRATDAEREALDKAKKARHKKGTPFVGDNLKDGETLTGNGSIRRGDYVITQAKTRDGKNGYAIVEQFGSHRMTRPTASKTLDKVRAEVDRMQAQRDKEQAARSLEFPELQLMSSAQLEAIAAGTGAKATAAQQLLNDRR
ncbi:DUF3560 domain-containing protein [Corynebacterium evansiae]|uniref:DNA polymerase III subunit beta family protein n=1 Tax=Corynebacterium evansiae TaxID=2913499 RepID=UPI003EBA437D